jgi:hypothetical protein
MTDPIVQLLTPEEWRQQCARVARIQTQAREDWLALWRRCNPGKDAPQMIMYRIPQRIDWNG